MNYKRYKFFSRAQESDEIIDQYVTVLRKISETCEFVTLKNSLIKDVLGISDATDKREIAQDFRPRPGKGYRRSSICRGNRKTIKGHDKVDKPLICTWNMMELIRMEKKNKHPSLKRMHSANEDRPSSSKIFHCRNFGIRHGVREWQVYGKTCRNCKHPCQEHVPVSEKTSTG